MGLRAVRMPRFLEEPLPEAQDRGLAPSLSWEVHSHGETLISVGGAAWSAVQDPKEEGSSVLIS